MKIVLAPDSFKGSLSAPQVCEALSVGLKRAIPDAQIVHCPMADGGEGTLDAVLAAAGGVRHTRKLPGASAQPLDADYAILPDGSALIEVAQLVGITEPVGMATDVASRHTVGIGVLMRVLIEQGVRKFFIGLGGTSTNDGGAGLLVGLGARMFEGVGNIVPPTPAALVRVGKIDLLDLPQKLEGVTITLLSDVNNPLLGDLGATAIFGPQKGVQRVDLLGFDTALRTYAEALETALGKDASTRDAPGAGAAGGLGYTLMMLGATMESGAQVVANLVGLDAALTDADWLISGEGRSDKQTLLGKTPFVAAKRAMAAAPKAKRTLISGGIDLDSVAALNVLFNGGCFSLVNRPMSLEEALADTEHLLGNVGAQCGLLVGL
jgi:glycerate 2-kinase